MMYDAEGGNSGSSAIGGRSSSTTTNRKRKNSEQPAADDDGVSVPRYIRCLFDVTRLLDDYQSFFSLDYCMNMYSVPLRLIVDTVKKYDPIREKVCGKIWGQFLDFMKENVEQAAALYSLLAYPNFLEWLNEMKTVTDCRGKAIKHMSELLNSRSSSSQDDDNYRVFPWNETIPKREPHKLLCELRPYTTFLKWLQEEDDEEEKEEYKWLTYNGLIESFLEYFSNEARIDDVQDEVHVQKILNGVQLYVELLKKVYSVPLRLIVDTVKKYDPIREKVCGKIWGEFLDFINNNNNVSEHEHALYSLLAYPNFIEWLNEMKTVTDCRGKAIKHMLELLNSSLIIIIKEDNYSGFPWNRELIPEPEPSVYASPQKLLRELRPYSTFLKWLQEDVVEEEDKWLNYYGPQKTRARFIEGLLKYFSDARIDDDDVGVHLVLHGLHIHVDQLKRVHEREVPAAEKKQEPPKKGRSNPYTLNPILDGLSEADRGLLTGFHSKYQDVPLLVLPEYREYHNQLMRSEGFDFDTYPGSFDNMSPVMPIGLFASQFKNIDFNKLAEYAANEKFGENRIKIEKVVSVNLSSRSLYARCYHLTFLGLYEKSSYHFKALVKGSSKGANSEETYKVESFSPEYFELNKRVTRSSAKSKAQNLESELKVDKQPKATRRSSRSIAQGSESEGTKEKVSEGEYSNHNCEKHRKDLSLINSFIDMPADELLENIRGPAKAPPIKELRKYFEEVSESEGFHIGKYPGFFPIVTSIIRPFDWELWGLGFIPIEDLAKLAIESYNNENRSGFGFDKITEVNVSERMHYHYYISFLAHAGDAAAAETFQALVSVNMRLLRDYQVHFCRIAIATK